MGCRPGTMWAHMSKLNDNFLVQAPETLGAKLRGVPLWKAAVALHSSPTGSTHHCRVTTLECC